ncbi:hypothetical protein PHYBLDRAFT_146484 [Phycomyces blakesleeanus NRRL 1555(-)]|uniref:Uncharacterized protein n=2 Tax=Phycomyces blakesleeanus TaxID=4837 RepID=A0A163DM66_PHYB8|nr:hypothetical protein PHYBLDRAFT_146484 [Phycomyces blakesleeanus NRRL 1555(-)]OAD72280.1 hypothetical protein PHYBLDRAFT_146484 [Phycomyces blakesleeanus NRRL 1555(-)]|eukprot:XP_018290320.1 hypothetical protein PHYBLDRAFT_146484 [Phycomyces blakesleeanus NRRL 1555(-)]
MPSTTPYLGPNKKTRRHSVGCFPFTRTIRWSRTRSQILQRRYTYYPRRSYRASECLHRTSAKGWDILHELPQTTDHKSRHTRNLSMETYFSCQTQWDTQPRTWKKCKERRHSIQSELTLCSQPLTPAPRYTPTRRPATFSFFRLPERSPDPGSIDSALIAFETSNALLIPTESARPAASTRLSFFRNTIATISSLTSASTRTNLENSNPRQSRLPTLPDYCHPYDIEQLSQQPSSWVSMSPTYFSGPIPVFHVQSLMFLFGFLFFPCWWIGGFLVGSKTEEIKRLVNVTNTNTNTNTNATTSPTTSPIYPLPTLLVVHPSMLANGRTASRLLWLDEPGTPDRPVVARTVSSTTLVPSKSQYSRSQEFIWRSQYLKELSMFRRWNRIMSFISLALIGVVVAMILWYSAGIQYSWWQPI